jgi:2-methylisocitrate lyase-like PEP mutase family enzyme
VTDLAARQRLELSSAADALLAAHHGDEPLVLPNAWDVASARVVEELGFPAIATSSRAIANVLGERDDDTGDPDLIFPFLARIAAAVACPVTADLEAGHGLAAKELVERMLAAGIVGCNLEDTDHHGDGVLVDAERQAAFLADVRAAAETADVHIVINARVDTFVRKVGDDRVQIDEAVRRGSLYLDAGADCVYPIMLADSGGIEEIVSRVRGPINIMARPGGPSIAALAVLGVRRISFGSGLHATTMGAFRQSVAALRP